MTFLKTIIVSAIIAAVSASAVFAETENKEEPAQPRPVRLNRENKTVEIDGRICLDEGPLELFACAEGGKEYESVIALKGEPWQIHLSLLLLGLKPGEGGPEWQGDATPPVGDPVIVEIEWEDEEGNKIRKRAEDLMWDSHQDAAMPHIEWTFSGSMIAEDENGNQYYAADRDRSIVTVFHDPLTILDNPLETGGDDSVYVVNSKITPPVDTPVTVIMRPGKRSEETADKSKETE